MVLVQLYGTTAVHLARCAPHAASRITYVICAHCMKFCKSPWRKQGGENGPCQNGENGKGKRSDEIAAKYDNGKLKRSDEKMAKYQNGNSAHMHLTTMDMTKGIGNGQKAVKINGNERDVSGKESLFTSVESCCKNVCLF